MTEARHLTPCPPDEGGYLESLAQDIQPVDVDSTAAILAAREQFLAGQEGEGQAEPQAPRFTLLSAEDVSNAPLMEWTIKGIIPRRGVGQAYGASMSGKSFLLLNMAAHVAEGKDWHDFRINQAPVVYVCLEGEEGFRKRVRALVDWRHRPLSSALHFVMQPFAINTAEDVTSLGAVVPKRALVIIDTQNASCPFIDENSTRDMGGIIAGAKDLARAIDGFVLLVAHTGKEVGRGPRGSSSQIPAWDCCIEVVRNGERREWVTRKVKDGQDGQRFPFRLAIIDLGEDEDGDRITSCVALPDDNPAHEEKPLTDNQRYTLESLRIALEKEGCDSIHVEEWRPHFYGGHHGDKAGTKKKAFDRGRKELILLELVTVKHDYYSLFFQGGQGHKGDIGGTSPDAQTEKVGDIGGHTPLGVSPCPSVSMGGQSHE